jgi:hypothetical protein
MDSNSLATTAIATAVADSFDDLPPFADYSQAPPWMDAAFPPSYDERPMDLDAMLRQAAPSMHKARAEFRPRMDRPGQPPQQRRERRKFTLISAEEMAARPPMEWLVDDTIPEKGTCIFYGPSQSGKSFLLLDLVGKICQGKPWFGLETKKKRVVYVVLEGEEGVPQRIKAYLDHHGPGTLAGCDFVTEELDIMAFDGEDLAWSLKEDGLLEEEGTVIVLDTLGKGAPGLDENSARDISLMFKQLRKITDVTKGLVILVHHTGKDGSKGPRGSIAIPSGTDASIRVDAIGDGSEAVRSWLSEKRKDADSKSKRGFKLVPLVVGQKQNGLPVSSCVVQESSEVVPDPVAKKGARLGDHQIVAYEVAKALIDESGSGIGYNDLLAGVMPKLKLSDSDEKRRKERAKAAIRSLIESKRLVAEEGVVTLPSIAPRKQPTHWSV